MLYITPLLVVQQKHEGQIPHVCDSIINHSHSKGFRVSGEQIFARLVMQLTCAFPCDIAAVSLQISPSLEGTPAQTTWLHLCYCIYS